MISKTRVDVENVHALIHASCLTNSPLVMYGRVRKQGHVTVL